MAHDTVVPAGGTSVIYGLTSWLDLLIVARRERAIEDELEQICDAEWDRELESLLLGESRG